MCRCYGFDSSTSLLPWATTDASLVDVRASAPPLGHGNPITPYDGVGFAYLRAGPANVHVNMSLEFYTSPGVSTVHFAVDFDTSEGAETPDDAAATDVSLEIGGGATTLFSMTPGDLPYPASQSGWLRRNYTFTTGGLHRLVFSVRNFGDAFMPSALA